MNDPHGITFDGENYHLFFQHYPHGTEWHHSQHWGHAISPDLVSWKRLPVALTPMDDEVGCWSGSIVMVDDTPHLFYTRPSTDEWGRGQVVLARGSSDFRQWHVGATLIDGPPSDDYFDFRDPHVRRDVNGYRMVVGAGKKGAGGVVLLYRSDDAITWRFVGEAISAERFSVAGIDTGTVWECPQLIEVDGRTVLIVSAMHQQEFGYTVYAVGDFNNDVFTPKNWGRFDVSNSAYASSVFTDADGSPCVMSWIKELDGKTPKDAQFAGAQSTVSRMSLVGDELFLQPHPNLMKQTQSAEVLQSDFLVSPAVILETVSSHAHLEVSHGLTLTVTPERVHISVIGEMRCELERRSDSMAVTVVLDADLVEVWVAGTPGMATTRVPHAASSRGHVGSGEWRVTFASS
jgi:beta-fructofuranosidase